MQTHVRVVITKFETLPEEQDGEIHGAFEICIRSRGRQPEDFAEIVQKLHEIFQAEEPVRVIFNS